MCCLKVEKTSRLSLKVISQLHRDAHVHRGASAVMGGRRRGGIHWGQGISWGSEHQTMAQSAAQVFRERLSVCVRARTCRGLNMFLKLAPLHRQKVVVT